MPLPKSECHPKGRVRVRLGTFLFVLGVLACAAVQLVRAYWALRCSVHFPGTVQTSGFESESLYAVFRAVHGQPVFTNPAFSPFCSSYFNWLFYLTNAAVVSPFVKVFGDVSIPLAGRMVDFAGCLTGVTALVTFWNSLARRSPGAPRHLGWMLAVFWGTGPLMGWWAFTLRPDVWAAAFEVLGLVYIGLRPPTSNARSALPAALAFFCAWSFKQTAVSGVVAASLLLLLERDLRGLLSLVFGYTFAVLIAYDVASPGYLAAFADLASNNRFDMQTWGANLFSFLAKASPLLILLALWRLGAPFSASSDTIPHPSARILKLGLLATLSSVTLTLMLTSKVGSATNYYFPVATSLTLLAFALLARRPPSAIALASSGATALALAVALFAGRVGVVSMAPHLRSMDARWNTFKHLDEPRWSADSTLDLP